MSVGDGGRDRAKWNQQRRWLTVLAALAVSLALYASGALSGLERSLTDARFRLLTRPPSGTVVIVEIDPKSLRSLDSWPWSRNRHAQLIDRLMAAGASLVAIDIDLSSRSSEDADAVLADALARARGRVVLPAFRQAQLGEDGRVDIVHTVPLPRFRRLVRIASVNASPSVDGLVRVHAAFHPWQTDEITSMPALLAEPARPLFTEFEIDYGIRPELLVRLSYVDVLRGEFDAGLIAGRKVIVGGTAVELGDQLSTPVHYALPGPIVQALAYESILQERTLKRAAPWLVSVISIIVCLLASGPLTRWSWRRGAILLCGIAVATGATSLALHAWTPMLFDVTPVIVAIVLQFVFALGLRIDRLDMALLLRTLRLRRSNAFMRNVVEHSSEGIITVTNNFVVGYANRAAGQIFGIDPSSLVGRRFETLLDVGNTKNVEALLANSVGHPRPADGRRPGGGTFPAELTSNEMDVGGELQYVVLLRDVSERRAQEELLEYLALHDTLTGLPNRALLMDRVEQAIARAERDGNRVALLLLDLDRFKQINDTLGHAVGDELLAEFGQALAGPLRRIDTVARLGGDEFAVLAPSLNGPEHARQIAERVAAALHRPFEIGELSLDVGVSIGVAIYPDHGTESSELMRSADVAMYMAKRERSTVALYDVEKDTNSVRNLSLGSDLRTAVRERELTIFYQPQVEVATGRPVAAEALIRWDHPRYGYVPPEEFIQLAEQTGVIRPLTRWILGEAVRQLAEWQHAGFDIGLSVNLSPRNLHEDDLSRVVSELFEMYSVRSDRLTIEITENAIMTDPARALDAIRDLKECGVRLAIDDFGTGYSSLAYLKSLPVDELKIDKSFVIPMIESGSDTVIVRSTVDLAHALGLTVVAEGVEDEAHLTILHRIGCDLAQGFHIAEPCDPETFARWMDENGRPELDPTAEQPAAGEAADADGKEVRVLKRA